VLICLAAAVVYLMTAATVFEAEADLLVNPQRDLPVAVPGIIQQSNDPTRDVETAARLLETPGVARRVKEETGYPGPARDLLERVDARPVAQSNIVAITAEAPTAEASARLANAFGEAFVEDRTERLRETIAPLIAALEGEVAAGGEQAVGTSAAGDAVAVGSQLRFLRSLEASGDPSVRLESRAEPPPSQSAPRPALTMTAAGLGGLVLGVLGAFGMSVLDPRLRTEDQLRSRFRLPILARVPRERSRRSRPLLPAEMSKAATEAHNSLRAALSVSREDGLRGRVVLVTGPSPGDGKSTTAINLAMTLSSAGKRVILIEADSRRPSMGRAFGVVPERGLASVTAGRSYLVDALVPVGGEDSTLRVLLTSPGDHPTADVLSHVSAETLLQQARKLADWVIIDSPPLNHVAETLTIARIVDDVLLVVRIGKTNSRDLDELAEMLVQQGITPTGFVTLSRQSRPGYY